MGGQYAQFPSFVSSYRLFAPYSIEIPLYPELGAKKDFSRLGGKKLMDSRSTHWEKKVRGFSTHNWGTWHSFPDFGDMTGRG